MAMTVICLSMCLPVNHFELPPYLGSLPKLNMGADLTLGYKGYFPVLSLQFRKLPRETHYR